MQRQYVWMGIGGFLSGYTTFSSYAFEGLTPMGAGQWFAALGYVVGSNALGLGAAYLGMVLARVVGR